jgi:hypothetical protein
VIAPWLDLKKELKIQGCFRLVEARGTLGVARPVKDNNFVFREVTEKLCSHQHRDNRERLQLYPAFSPTEMDSQIIQIQPA